MIKRPRTNRKKRLSEVEIEPTAVLVKEDTSNRDELFCLKPNVEPDSVT